MKVTDNIIVRQATAADEPDIRDLARFCHWGGFAEADLDAMFGQLDMRGVVAERYGEFAGFAYFGTVARSLVIVSLLVWPEHRLCGVGSRLLGDVCRRTGPKHERVEILLRRTDAYGQSFARRRGFRCADLNRQADAFWFDLQLPE